MDPMTVSTLAVSTPFSVEELALMAAIGLLLLVVVLDLVILPGLRRALPRCLRAGWRYGRNLPRMLWAAIVWPRLAASCGLARWKTTTRDGKTTERPVNVPATKRWRLTPAGYAFTVRHRYGQDTETIRAAASVLASGLSAAQVRVVTETTPKGQPRRDRCRVTVNRRDPFQNVPTPLGLSATRVRLGVLEDGRDWVYDARTFPHLLGAGATGSGKSSLQNTFLAALAPLEDVAVCLVDLKHGVSAEPYRTRASVIAETQEQAAALLADLLALGRARAAVCKAQGVDSVYDLRGVRLPEVYVLVDEVAELTYDDGTPDGKALAKACMRDLLRAVSLLRAFGIHVWVLGQRFGSSLGPQITSIRAQLPGRVCLGIADRETGDMAVGDLAPEAVRAALDITLPGVAVIKGGPDRWQMGRAAHTSHTDLARTAHRHHTKRIGWGRVMGEAADTHTTTELPAIEFSKESVS